VSLSHAEVQGYYLLDSHYDSWISFVNKITGHNCTFLNSGVRYDNKMKINARFFIPFTLTMALLAASLLQAQPPPGLLKTAVSPLTENQKPVTENRLFEDLEHAIAGVQPFLDRYGYAALFLAVLVEGVGLVAPGQTLLIAAALMAARGSLNLAWVLFWAFAAAIVGNSLGYLLGRRGGRPLLHKLRVNDKHLQRFEGYFHRYGRIMIIVARFFDGLRQLNGIVAGLVQMPWKDFTIWNILGAALWTGVWGLGTYFVEKKIAPLHFAVRLVAPWIAALTLLGILTLLVYILWPGRQPKS
jgi:membrane protein DedA with SNARE-associated domain